MFSYWEMVLFKWITRSKRLLLCHQQKLNIWQLHKQQSKQYGFHHVLGALVFHRWKPFVIYDDNQSCISLSKNPVFHASCTKHIENRHHLVKEKTKQKVLLSRGVLQHGEYHLSIFWSRGPFLLTSMNIFNILWSEKWTHSTKLENPTNKQTF
jgi:hypothetical protein